jgi:hypothetical protein
MGKKIAWIQDKITTMFGKDSTSTTLILVSYILWRLADNYGISEEVFLLVMGIVANIYNNLQKLDNADLKKKNYDQAKTLFLLGHGINPDETEKLYTQKNLPPAPQ